MSKDKKPKETLTGMYCRVPRSTLNQFKAICAKRGTSIQKAVTELITNVTSPNQQPKAPK